MIPTILNHPRGWDGKPTGSQRDSRDAEISNKIFGPGCFYFYSRQFDIIVINILTFMLILVHIAIQSRKLPFMYRVC